MSAQAAAISDGTPDDPVDLTGVPLEYHDYADVFSKKKANTLAPHQPFDLKIELEEGTEPPIGRLYSLSPLEQGFLQDFLDKHLTNGFICQSSSPHAAPVFFVQKKDGSLHLCINFQGLNKIKKKDQYPLPHTSNLLEAPSGAKIYTKLDLWHAYHLVHIADRDEWKTSFHTHYGSFEWLVMPFGLTNAPAAFQRFINSIFTNMLDMCIVVYLDDILIYSSNLASHCKHVRDVLQHLCANGLYLKPEKCKWHLETIEYLGYILSPSRLSMACDKIQTVLNWPKPWKVKDIQSFLGFANFYHRFIQGYSNIVVPLTRLTRKGVPWNFSDNCRKSFLCLKDAFTSTPVLVHWTPNAPITVETNASNYAITAILSLTCSNNEIHPVAFYSRTLTGVELNYDTHDKELLVIFEAFTTWRHYLEGSASPIDVVTDHKNLEYFSTTKLLTCCQA